MEITSVIKYEGDNSTFVWKHPKEDFNTLTQLIVHENQEAIFFMNGQALDTFGPGRHTLHTQNIPLIGKLLRLPFDGENPFHCEVYFINKSEQMAIKWGTTSSLEYMDPIYKTPFSIGASGEMSLCVEDGRKLLIKLIGTESGLGQRQLVDFFRGILNSKIKPYFAQYLKANNVSIFEIDEHTDKLSIHLAEDLIGDFRDYGVSLERFFITSIVKPEDDKRYKELKDLHLSQYVDIEREKIEAQKTIIKSQALATKRAQEGYTYQQERGFDVAEGMANNESVGQFSNIGIGMGTMAGVAGTMGTLLKESLGQAITGQPNLTTPATLICSKCGAQVSATSSFCDNCGSPVENTANLGFCDNCGYKFEKVGKFCPKCGAAR